MRPERSSRAWPTRTVSRPSPPRTSAATCPIRITACGCTPATAARCSTTTRPGVPSQVWRVRACRWSPRTCPAATSGTPTRSCGWPTSPTPVHRRALAHQCVRLSHTPQSTGPSPVVDHGDTGERDRSHPSTPAYAPAQTRPTPTRPPSPVQLCHARGTQTVSNRCHARQAQDGHRQNPAPSPSRTGSFTRSCCRATAESAVTSRLDRSSGRGDVVGDSTSQ